MILAHDVYFTLHDAREAAQAKLVAACLEHLSGYDGCVAMSAGTRAREFDRPMNDAAFHVALHVYLKDRAAHDAYQEHPRHKRFIEESRPNWKEVRVFDSWVEAPPGPQGGTVYDVVARARPVDQRQSARGTQEFPRTGRGSAATSWPSPPTGCPTRRWPG